MHRMSRLVPSEPFLPRLVRRIRELVRGRLNREVGWSRRFVLTESLPTNSPFKGVQYQTIG